MTAPTLRTERLLLRPFEDDDRAGFAELNADPAVMEHLPTPLTRAESDAMVERIRGQFEEHGFGLWALELEGTGAFLGFTGLSRPRFTAPFTPCVEVGWRLARAHWGHGYATEAAREAVRFGFENLGLAELVSFTVPENFRSRRVMERLGFTHHPGDDFDHPLLPVNSPLRRHVLYRRRREG